MKKTITKQLIGFTLLLVFQSFAVWADNKPSIEGDSIIINFGESSRMIIQINSENDIASLEEISFDNIIASVGQYVDSAKNTPDGTFTVKNDLGRYEVHAEEVDEKPKFEFLLGGNDESLINIRNWKKETKVKHYRDDDDHSGMHFNLDFGLNGYVQDGSIPTNTNYELRPWGSRYVEIQLRYRKRLGSWRGNSPFFLNYGMSVSWYNFMLDGDNRVIEVEDQIQFIEEDFELKKSKLTASYLNIPVVLQYRHQNGFKIGVGGSVGYRLGSHTKIKYEDNNGNNQTDKDRGNFNLESIRYGVRGEIGYKNVLFFGTYDFNNLFASNSGAPQLNAFSFGIRVL